MTLASQQIRTATLIDEKVKKIIQEAKTSDAIDEALVEIMPDHMGDFKYLLDSLQAGDMDRLCEKFNGFYQFAKMMERIAEGCRDGVFKDIISKVN